VVADVDAEGLEETPAQIKVRNLSAEAASLDVTDTAAVDAVARAHLDTAVLVAAPGINVRKKVLDTTDVRLKGTYRLARAFAPGMVQRGRGSIINFSSFRAVVVEPVPPTRPRTSREAFSWSKAGDGRRRPLRPERLASAVRVRD
jgi:short-subunit dehydrogenase